MYERRRVNVKFERGSIFTYKRELPYNASKIYVPSPLKKKKNETAEIHLQL